MAGVAPGTNDDAGPKHHHIQTPRAVHVCKKGLVRHLGASVDVEPHRCAAGRRGLGDELTRMPTVVDRDRGRVVKAYATRTAELGEAARRLDVEPKVVVPGGPFGASEVVNVLDAFERGFDRGGVGDVALRQFDPLRGKQLRMARCLADQCAQLHAIVKQTLDQRATDEACAAQQEHGWGRGPRVRRVIHDRSAQAGHGHRFAVA